MNKAYFPMFVDLSEKKIVVVGGGNIASRRIGVLTSFTDNITVVAPQITMLLKKLEAEKKICWKNRSYKKEDIMDADMVFAATNNKTVNRSIAADCRSEEKKKGSKILINIADDRTMCDFYFPSVIHKDEIIIGLNSGGENPRKVKQLREKLDKFLTESLISLDFLKK